MAAKEKAVELVEKFTGICRGWSDEVVTDDEQAKQCALIAVDEIDNAINFDWMEVQNLDRAHTYWEQVKQEIINL